MNEIAIGSVEPVRLLKASEVATLLNISRAMAYRLMQRGEIPTVRIAGCRRVRHQDLEKYIKDNIYPSIPKAS